MVNYLQTILVRERNLTLGSTVTRQPRQLAGLPRGSGIY